jgi:hypothetical protein
MYSNTIMMIVAALLIAFLLLGGVFGFGLNLNSMLAGGTQVQVSIDGQTIEAAEAAGITYITLHFYASTDSGDDLVESERISIISSQTLNINGLVDAGSVTIAASLPDGDTTELREPSDTHIDSGEVIHVYFTSSSDPFWAVS